MMRVTRLVPTVMALALVAGCGGGQSGDLSGESGKKGGSTAAGNGCDEQLNEVSLDDASVLGFDAQSVLSFAQQPFQTDLSWVAADHVDYSPSASQSALTLALSSLDKAWVVHSVPAQSSNQEGGGTLAAVLCPPDHLRMRVHAELHSADGALAESFEGSLNARSSYVATLEHAIDPEHVAGTFQIEHVTSAVAGGSATVQNLRLDAVLTPGGMAGALTAQLTSMNSQVASGSPLTFARFPSDARCSSNPGNTNPGVPVSAGSAALGQTGTDALAEVNDWGALSLEWQDRAQTTLELELSDLGDGCVQPANDIGLDPALPVAMVVYPVTLKATTADGLLQGQYSASLITFPTPGGVGFSQRIALDRTFAADALGATGFKQVAVPNGTERLRVGLEALFSRGDASGKVSLTAMKDPPCVTNPEPPSANSSPGCSGTELTTVTSGYWPH